MDEEIVGATFDIIFTRVLSGYHPDGVAFVATPEGIEARSIGGKPKGSDVVAALFCFAIDRDGFDRTDPIWQESATELVRRSIDRGILAYREGRHVQDV